MDYITDPLTFLDYVQFYPTLRCNMSCGFCFNQNVKYTVHDIKVKSFKAVIKRLKVETPVRTLDILGGEPFLHDELTDIIENAIKEGFRLNISTNGTMKERIFNVVQTYKEIKTGISINSIKQLLSLSEMLHALRPIVKSLYMKNMDMEMVEFIGSLGLEYYLIYQDELSIHRKNGMLGFEDFHDFVRSKKGAFFSGPVYCSGFLPEIDKYPILEYLRCPAGTVKIGILPNGDVYPCNLFFSLEEFCLGNILKDPIDVILRHPLLNFFREFNGNQCPKRDCSLHDLCHGGCPAHSYIHFNQLDAPEPRCLCFTHTRS